jgi:hypothetical protein
MSVAIPLARVEILRGLWFNDDDFQDGWTVNGGTLTTDGEIATLTIEASMVSISKPCAFNSAVHKYAIIECTSLSAAQWQFKARRASDQVWVVVATFSNTGVKTIDISAVYSGEVDMIGIDVSGTVGQSAQFDYVVVASQTMLVPTDDKDVLDLRVHLGLVEEVGSFELSMQNFDAKYTGQVAVGNWVKIWANRADSSLLKIFTGRVEEVEFDASSTENYVALRGRDRGEELFRRTVTKTYENVKAEDVVKDLIDNLTTLKHVRGTTELVENTDTTYTLLEYENTPVFDILKDLAKSAEKDGVVGFDFRTSWDGKFEFFKCNSKTSPVSLADRIEVAGYRKDIHRIRNKVTVYGAAEKANPSTKDAWTEDLTAGSNQLIYYENSELYGWWEPVGYCSVAKDGSIRIVGSYSVKLSTTQPVGSSVVDWYFATGHLFDANKYPSLTFQFRRENVPGEVGVKVELMDSSDQKVRRMFRTDPGKWDLQKFSVGEKQDSEWTHDEFNTQDFDWSQIRRVRFEAYFNGNGSGSFWVDNLFFNSKRWEDTQEDSASQQAFGLREIVEVDEELHSDNECSLRAKAMLSYLKDPAEYITLRSDVISLQSGRLLPGDKTHVSLPNENIDADYRILTVEYYLIAKEQTLEVTLELGKEPPLLANIMSNLCSKTDDLSRNKAGPTGVAGTIGGGGGSGGDGAPTTATYITINDETSNLPNAVRHINVAEAEKHTPKLHKDSHKTGGEDAFSINDLLDAVARVKVRKNSGASDVGSRRRLNLIEGANVTLTVADDPTDEEVDVTITSSGGGSGGSLEDHWMDMAKQIAVLRPSYYDHNYAIGTATITRYSNMWQLYVGTTKTSVATTRSRALASGYTTPNFWDKNPQFTVGFNIDTLTSGGDNIDVRILLAEFSLALSENELTASRRRIGIRISGTTLYLLTNPGAASDTMVQIKTGLTAGFHRVRVKLVSNTKAQVWFDDDAVWEYTTTSNLPSGQQTNEIFFSMRLTGIAETNLCVHAGRWMRAN